MINHIYPSIKNGKRMETLELDADVLVAFSINVSKAVDLKEDN